jgi:multiple sugar transport system permease protein
MATVAGGERHELGQPVPADVQDVPIRPTRRKPAFRPMRLVRYVMLTVLAVIFVAPFAYMVSASFQPMSQMFRLPPNWIPDDPTLANYTGYFGSGRNIDRWLFNSFYIATFNTVNILFFSSLTAYTFAKRTFPGRDFLFLLGLSTLMLPFEVTLIPNYIIMKNFPLLGGNDIAGAGGTGMLNSYWALIFPNVSSVFGIFLLRQYMKSAIPDELIDAARIDGAGHFRIFWRVVLPLCKPALAAVGIFTFQFYWSDLLGPLIFTGSNPDLWTLPLGLTTFVLPNRSAWDLIMAGSVLATVPLIVIFFVFQRQFVRGISISGIKG